MKNLAPLVVLAILSVLAVASATSATTDAPPATTTIPTGAPITPIPTNFTPSTDVKISEAGVTAFIFLVAIFGFAFGIFWWWWLGRTIKVSNAPEETVAINNKFLTHEVIEKVYNISTAISDGATTFLLEEYKYMALFVIVFGTIMFILLGSTTDNYWGNAGFSLLSFFLGSITSIMAGWIGMRVAVFTNSRTALQATNGASEGDLALQFRSSFQTAFRGGLTMGFCLTSAGLAMLFINILIIKAHYSDDPKALYEAVAAFGLGGSAIACFGRVGGGIFTKAADVGSDLVGKLEQNIPEDDPRNPGVIADCIGDNVGDIAGMGSDLFGSFGEASCAALVIASQSSELSANFTAMMFPLVVTACGIVVCMITTNHASVWSSVNSKETVEPALALQLFLPTLINSAAMAGFSYACLPDTFHIARVFSGTKECRWYHAYICVMMGLWAGLIIGYVTYLYTSGRHGPTQEVARACKTGAATNIIYGLALGYLSVIIPCTAMAIAIYVSYNLCLLYGFALAALGILSTMSVGLTIDAYGPISDNAGGIAEMAEMGKEIRAVTDALDAAGNTTAAIGKGFAISSAAFVGLALYGAYITRVFATDPSDDPYAAQKAATDGIARLVIIDPRVLSGLLMGAMLPYWFSALTMKSVGEAAMKMVEEIRRQFRDIPGLMDGRANPDYNECVRIATEAALHKMIAPGLLVILSPIICGIVFGKEALAGMLPGSLVSGVQMAISSSNTGGAWDNAKKYIEAGNIEGERKGGPVHAAAVVGDTVGDPLKDTSGPSLNILIKLMAIISVVYAPVIKSKSLGGLLFERAWPGFNQPAFSTN